MPGFMSFQSVTGRNTATLFEIRLENDLIVLRGAENEASSQMLRGVVVLCLRDSEKVQDVHLKLTGQCKVGWSDQKLTASGVSTHKVNSTAEFYNHKWPPFVGGEGNGSSSRGVTLGATNYEWPFELIIEGGMAESVEGLYDSHIMYKLKATVARGKWAYDLHATKALRIIRTLDPAALELAHAMTVENVWPNKIEYSLVIPQKAIIFGTSIGVEMKFTSLLKGLKIGTIKCQLVEIQEFSIHGPGHLERYHKNTRDVNNWSFELSDDHYQDMMNDSGQDGFVLSEILPLPKSLKKCMQDCDTKGIKIRHKVKFNIALLNPDGHVSELRATLPVTIFISPNMAIDEAGNLLDQTPNSTQSQDIGAHAPPLYGEHMLDQLYAEFPTSGYMTPAPQSGMNTPFYNQSRHGSAENLSSMDGIASTAIRPDALSSRLQNLNSSSRNSSFLRRNAQPGSGGNTPGGAPGTEDYLNHGHGSSIPMPASSLPRAQTSYFGDAASSLPRVQSGYFGDASSRSNPLSRRTSEEDPSGGPSGMTSGQQTPEHIDFSDYTALSKVPSYTTAVRSPVRGMSYSDAEALPTYDATISSPPSPVRGHATPVPPAQAHLPNGGPPTPGLENGPSLARQRNPLMGMGLTPITREAGVDDAGRRLHLIQARGRAH